MPSGIKEIIGKLETQKAAIEKAIAALKEVDQVEAPSAQPVEVAARGKKVATATRKKRVLSPEGRRRIVEATRRRWAKVKRAAKKAA